ncbi:MAG: DNA translocase FtsK 4TM domain-containing protein, partial [Cyclobacteriaceae bacterium]|nr:DNA translocase FtsK 4TM domain-containing protein [Cyclobacteriaceae bacterium]
MAENKPKGNTFKESKKGPKPSLKIKNPFSDRRFQLAFGFFLITFSLFLFISFISYLFSWKADQSVVDAYNNSSLIESGLEVKNILGLYGALFSHYFIFKWFGLAAFFIPPVLFVRGWKITTNFSLVSEPKFFVFSVFSILWVSLLLGYFMQSFDGLSEFAGFLSGGIGYQLALLIGSLLGWGTYLFLALFLIVFIIFFFNITSVKNENNSKVMASKAKEDEIKHKAYDHEDDQWFLKSKPEQDDPDDDLLFEDDDVVET